MRGNRLSYTLQRLYRDRSDLYEKVVRKEMTANAAAIEAGWRTKTVTVPLTIDGVFRAALKLSESDRVELVRMLSENDLV